MQYTTKPNRRDGKRGEKRGKSCKTTRMREQEQAGAVSPKCVATNKTYERVKTHRTQCECNKCCWDVSNHSSLSLNKSVMIRTIRTNSSVIRDTSAKTAGNEPEQFIHRSGVTPSFLQIHQAGRMNESLS